MRGLVRGILVVSGLWMVVVAMVVAATHYDNSGTSVLSVPLVLNGDTFISLVNPENGNFVPIRRVMEGRVDRINWSPNGQSILLTIITEDDQFEQYVLWLDGQLVPLSHLVPPWHFFSWAPDGNRLVYPTPSTTLETCLDLFTIKPDGSDAQQLTHLADSSGCSYTVSDDVAWSPDSSVLGFSVNNTIDNRPEIMRMSADGQNLTVLGSGRWLTWSPDGQWIYFFDGSGGRDWSLYRMRPDGQTRELFSSACNVVGYLGWSTDQTMLRCYGPDSQGKDTPFYYDQTGNVLAPDESIIFHEPGYFEPIGTPWRVGLHLGPSEASFTYLDIQSGPGERTRQLIDYPLASTATSWSPPIGNRFRAGIVVGLGAVLIALGLRPGRPRWKREHGTGDSRHRRRYAAADNSESGAGAAQ